MFKWLKRQQDNLKNRDKISKPRTRWANLPSARSSADSDTVVPGIRSATNVIYASF